MVTCIVGINWGDEGKGRVADLLSRDVASWETECISSQTAWTMK